MITENKDLKIKFNNRKSVSLSLSDFCIFADKYDFIEVTEWSNGEGCDISIIRKRENNDFDFKLTHGEIDALITLISELNKHID